MPASEHPQGLVSRTETKKHQRLLESEAGGGGLLGEAKEAVTGGAEERGILSAFSLALLPWPRTCADVRGVPDSSRCQGKGLEGLQACCV